MNGLDELCRSFLKELDNDKLLTLAIPKGTVGNEQDDDAAAGNMDLLPNNAATISRRFTSALTRRKYVQLFAVAALVAELQSSNRSMLLRDIYYALKHLFKNQQECNAIVLDLGRMLHLRRHEMNIIASSKALIFGPIRFRFLPADPAQPAGAPEVAWTSCHYDATMTGVVVDSHWTSTAPRLIDIELTDPTARYLVVVEKEAIFHRLVEDGFTRHQQPGCILITSCGYPDVAVRAAVSRIANFFPILTTVGLADYNPHGYALLQCFRNLSKQSSFEAAGMLADMRWLGMRHSHVQQLLQDASLGSDRFRQSMQPVTAADRLMLEALLEKDQVSPAARQELQDMLQGGMKCELEALYSFGMAFVSQYLQMVLNKQDHI